jgi:hypothetical protein
MVAAKMLKISFFQNKRLIGFPLSDKATAHKGILSTPRDFKKGFSSSLTSP